MKKGKFIVFEGIDGAGKTTQAKKLFNYLKEKGIKAVLTKEPGGTDIGSEIRKILLNKNYNIPPIAELLLYEADRSVHINNLIKPSLNEGYTVISDRYIYSTVVYQSFGRGIDRSTVDYLNSLVTGGLKPDVVFLLDIPVEEGLKRIKKHRKTDRIESEDVSFYTKLRNGFLKLAEGNRNMFYTINASKSQDCIFKIVIDRLNTLGIIGKS